jgi:1,4-dihydroxy-2-naphthoate polyprenyltransferase
VTGRPRVRPRAELLLAFIRLGRPQFLGGGFLLYGLGAAVAVAQGASLRPALYLLGQGAITSIQLMTHYANDYFDLAADQVNATPTRWSGGSRVLPAGSLSPRVALVAALVLAGAALVLIGLLASRGGDTCGAAALALLAAQALAWFYSAPPLVLHSRGLGELCTAVVVTGLTPLVGFLLQVGTTAAATGGAPVLAAALVPLLGLQFAMLLAIELPDAAGDALVGKRTLVVRLGGARAAALLRAVLIAVYGSIPLLLRAGLPPVAGALGAALSLPVAIVQFRRLGGGGWADPRRWEGVAFRGVGLVATTAAGQLIGFAAMAMRG